MRCKPEYSKKKLGQNFLYDRNILQKIVSACEFAPSDLALEIGPGRGDLTSLVIPCVKRLYAVEIDSSLCKILNEKFKNDTRVKIINQDILKFNLSQCLDSKKQKLKVIGNIPYYITTAIIQKLIKEKSQIDTIHITVQKEFAKRIVASAGNKDYGSFSCYLQYYSEPEIIFPIKRNSFRPSPKVDSMFLRLKIRSKPKVEVNDEALLFKIIKTSFCQRRKMLKNSLKKIISEDKIDRFFSQYKISTKIRPEMLKLEEFAKLANL